MMSISTPTYDLNGNRIFTRIQNSDMTQVSRRGSRTGTLDGGSVITDGGHCPGDRTINMVQVSPSQEDKDFCQYIVKYYAEVIVSCEEGLFLVWPQTTSIKNGELYFTLLVKEEL